MWEGTYVYQTPLKHTPAAHGPREGSMIQSPEGPPGLWAASGITGQATQVPGG